MSEAGERGAPKAGAGHRMYGDLARWWPLISPVDDYAEEAEEAALLLADAGRKVETVLELGCGGGNNGFHLKKHFRLTLTDLSEGMLAHSRALNPECEHVQGDMFTLRLGRRFDAVFVHDAIDYATSEEEVAAVIATAFEHCEPGGVALFMPDQVRETFEPSTDCGGSDGPDGEGARYLEWTYDPDPSDTRATTEYAFVLREADGTVHVAAETHVGGLFPTATWLALIARQGFEAESFTERTTDDRTPRVLFKGRRPPPPQTADQNA